MPKELPKNLYKTVEQLTTSGNGYVDAGDYNKAIKQFSDALNLLPSPKEQWEAFCWISVAIADTLFLGKTNFREAETHLQNALKHGGRENPFIHLRLGQVLYELSEQPSISFVAKEEYKSKAATWLASAYAIEGDEIFNEQDPKYLALVRGQLRQP